MDPFVQAAKRLATHSALAWKVGGVPVLRAVAAAEQRSDLIQALRWEEAQPECRRPLIVVEDPFAEGKGYLEAVTRQVLAGYELLRTAASEAGVTLPEVQETSSPEPVVQAVKTAEVAAAALPASLDGLTVVLAPERVRDDASWAALAAGLLRAATVLSRTDNAARPQAVRWLVHDTSGGALAAALGEGVEFALDDGALFAWMKKAGERAPSGARPGGASGTAGTREPLSPPETLSVDGAAGLQEHVLAAVEALRAREPRRAVESFRAARAICAGEGRGAEEAGIVVSLAGAQLAAANPAEAAASYRVAVDLATRNETWPLACQAKLGEAGAELLQRHHREAARAYVEAAGLAARAEVVALRVEALRMAGVCHLLGGDKQETVRLWQTAVDAGLGLDKATREPTSFAQVANDLVELLERLGMTLQAVDVRRRLGDESGASPEELPGAPGLPATATQERPIPADNPDATQEVRIFLPRKALPFVAGAVDLEWLDALVRAGEATEASPRDEGADSASTTQELRVPAGLAVLPFAGASTDRKVITAAVKVIPEARSVPFVAGGVDPALFRKPDEDTLDDTHDGAEEAEQASTTQEIRVRPAAAVTPFRRDGER